MLRASRRELLLPENRRPLAALAVVLVGVLYTWPLLAGAASTAASRADQLLRLAAVTGVALACLSASWRHEGRARTALLFVVVGAQTWACVQVVHLSRDLLGRSEQFPVLDAAGVVALTGCGAAALWLLRSPGSRAEESGLAAEWALVAVSILLLVRFAVPVFWASGDPRADWARAVGIGALLAGALLVWVRPGSTERAWPLLPGAMAVLAAALALATSASVGLPARLPGLLLASCLAVVALAVALGGVPRVPATALGSGSDGPPAIWGGLCLLPLSALAAVVLDAFANGSVHPVGLGGVVVLGLLAVAHGHLLGVQARREVRQLLETEHSMRHRAFHDDLTGLANRALLLDRLTLALDLHRRHRLPVSVLYCDLDGFKHVNDRYGHAVGDAVLTAVAERLRQCLRPEDTLARLGGDEFVLLLEHASSSAVVADRLHAALLAPITVGDLAFELSMSIGSARVEEQDPTPSPQDVIERADAAMYLAKADAHGLAAPAPRAAVPALDLAGALAEAIGAGQLSVVYQPLVDAATGEVHGAEALVRWRHAGRVLLPESFVALADRLGLSGALTDAVLEQACAQLSTWSAAAGHHRLTVSVNVPPSQIGDPTLSARVRAAIDRHGLQPDQVVLETSVAALSALPQVDLTDADGPRLALAGFTGAPEEFALLSALPVRAVKVAGDRLSGGDRLLPVLVALALELDVRVVVERVQRPAELEELRQLRGVLAQGYLLLRPAEAAELDEVVLRGCPLPV